MANYKTKTLRASQSAYWLKCDSYLNNVAKNINYIELKTDSEHDELYKMIYNLDKTNARMTLGSNRHKEVEDAIQSGEFSSESKAANSALQWIKNKTDAKKLLSEQQLNIGRYFNGKPDLILLDDEMNNVDLHIIDFKFSALSIGFDFNYAFNQLKTYVALVAMKMKGSEDVSSARMTILVIHPESGGLIARHRDVNLEEINQLCEHIDGRIDKLEMSIDNNGNLEKTEGVCSLSNCKYCPFNFVCNEFVNELESFCDLLEKETHTEEEKIKILKESNALNEVFYGGFDQEAYIQRVALPLVESDVETASACGLKINERKVPLEWVDESVLDEALYEEAKLSDVELEKMGYPKELIRACKVETFEVKTLVQKDK